MNIKNTKIEYSTGNTFSLPVLPFPGNEFTAGMSLRFIISASEQTLPIIDKYFDISEDLTFTVSLSETETKKLQLGEYLYKMTAYQNNQITTEVSGYFNVVWGATSEKKTALILGNKLSFTIELKEEISKNTEARHTHSNKDVLDGITEESVTKWNEYDGIIKSMQSQIAKMVKPEYITNASYMFCEGANADLLTFLNTAYIEVADSTFKKSPNEDISFDAVSCQSMQHCFESSSVVTVTFPRGTPELVYANHIFNKCANLTTVTGLDCTDVTTLKYAFNGCASLEAISLISTANVKDFSYAFYNSALVEISGLDTSSATQLDGMCAKSKITSITLDCTNVASAKGIFTDCPSLSAFTLKSLTDSGVALEVFNSLPTTEAGTITLENCAISEETLLIAGEKGWTFYE